MITSSIQVKARAVHAIDGHKKDHLYVTPTFRRKVNTPLNFETQLEPCGLPMHLQ
jgi:hypothetical protein